MPLPVVGNTLELVYDADLGKAVSQQSAVTGHNANYIARWGNATWVGTKLKFSADGLRNYWYIPDVPDEVSIAVVHETGYGQAYVLSKNYGGCEYHELYNATSKQIAFLHVYKGSGGLATYPIGAGWVLRSRIYSKGLMARFGGKPVWSISCIDRITSPATVTSQFIGIQGFTPPPVTDVSKLGTGTGATTSNPMVTITDVDDGTNPPP
jgi:hypothetical protein